jgi:hypothetical protein
MTFTPDDANFINTIIFLRVKLHFHFRMFHKKKMDLFVILNV